MKVKVWLRDGDSLEFQGKAWPEVDGKDDTILVDSDGGVTILHWSDVARVEAVPDVVAEQIDAAIGRPVDWGLKHLIALGENAQGAYPIGRTQSLAWDEMVRRGAAVRNPNGTYMTTAQGVWLLRRAQLQNGKSDSSSAK